MAADRTRILLNLGLALAQPGAAALAPVFGIGHSIASIAEASRTPVVPAGYAFVIWTPIFLLAIAYGIWQALPARRADPLLRRIGWASAAAWGCNIAWMVTAQLTANGWHLAIILAAGLGAALAAFLPLARHAEAETPMTRWLLRPLFGLLAGWVSAAAFVNLSGAAKAEGFGWFGYGSVPAAMLVVLLAAGFAGAVLRLARGDVWYAAAVLWALVGIIVANVLGPVAAMPVAAVATMCMVLVVLAVLRARRAAAETLVPAAAAAP